MPSLIEAIAIFLMCVGLLSLTFSVCYYLYYLGEKVRSQREKNRAFIRRFEAQERHNVLAAEHLARVIRRPLPGEMFETVDLHSTGEGDLLSRTLPRTGQAETAVLFNQSASVLWSKLCKRLVWVKNVIVKNCSFS